MKKHRFYFLFSLLLAITFSCTDHDGDPTTVAEMDREFMVKAADGNMFEIMAGEIAEKKALTDSVKAYGHNMVMDHSMATQELMALASKKSVTLPTSLSAPKKLKIDSLNALSGINFDKMYMTMMVASHVETISLFEMEASGGIDQEVKSWAAGKLPTLKHHLEKAEKVKSAL